MTRLTNRFEQLRAHGEKALIAYVTAGDPAAERTVKIVLALRQAGVDVVELGIPFSDPLADGPSIQASSQRALERGMTVPGVLAISRAIRREAPDLPLVLMTYYNPILRYGLERYAADAKDSGVDGHIVTDLTPEESHDWKRISTDLDLDTIFLLAPTSTPQRISTVAQISSGFLYCVSRTGVTGARKDVPVELTEVVGRIKAGTRLPVCVGFGISAPEHVSRICAFADGVVVGSSLVDLIDRQRDDGNLLEHVRIYASALKAPTRLSS